MHVLGRSAQDQRPRVALTEAWEAQKWLSDRMLNFQWVQHKQRSPRPEAASAESSASIRGLGPSILGTCVPWSTTWSMALTPQAAGKTKCR